MCSVFKMQLSNNYFTAPIKINLDKLKRNIHTITGKPKSTGYSFLNTAASEKQNRTEQRGHKKIGLHKNAIPYTRKCHKLHYISKTILNAQ